VARHGSGCRETPEIAAETRGHIATPHPESVAPRLLASDFTSGVSDHVVNENDRGQRDVRNNVVVAAALTSVIMLVGFVHAPVIPVIAGAALACAWTLWRASGT